MATSTTACAHCGLPVTPEALIAGSAFCCNGCEAIYDALCGAGLEAFYKERATTPKRAAITPNDAFAQFDDTDFARLYTSGQAGTSLRRVDLFVEGVHCAACVWVLEKLPALVPGVVNAELNYGESLLHLTWDSLQVPLSRVAHTLSDLGYPPHPAHARHDSKVETAADRTLLARIGVAGAAFGNVMLLSFALYSSEYGGLDMGRDYEDFFRWASLAITVPSVLWTAWPFFRGGITAVRTRTPHMDLPVSIGIAAALIWGTVSTATLRGDIYFDSVTMLVFLLLLGRLVQNRQQRHARRATDLLLALSPSTSRLVENGVVRVVPTQAVPKHALIEIRTGERIGVDGVLERGDSNIDESLLTGESKPRRVTVGDCVAAGTVNLSQPVYVRSVSTGQDTRLAHLVREMERASERRAPVVLLADKLSAQFVRIVLGLAVLTFLYWLPSGVTVAIDRAVSLLIVTCPCALGLATPLAAGAALGRAAKQGLLVKGMKYLELIAAPGLLVFDKTGTLTTGKLSLMDGENLDRIAPFVRAAESASGHPIATALLATLPAPTNAPILVTVSVEEKLGRGVTAAVQTPEGDVHSVHVGSRAFVQSLCAFDDDSPRVCSLLARGLSPLYVVIDGNLAAILGMGDPLRADTAATLSELHELGYELAVLSGDRAEVVAHVVAQTGVRFAIVASEQSPEQKLAFIEGRAQHGPVYMVGDGVNDAAALRAARVGIAVCGGAEASLAAADVFSTKPGLSPVLELVIGSRKTLRTIQRNLQFSLSYNIAAAILAVTGYVNPLLAAILMPLSSLTVVTNSFRARTFQSELVNREATRAPTPREVNASKGKQ
jgi:P-type Cu2+ transporter